MAWPDELDELPPWRWQSHLMRERLDFSLSVEATLAEKALEEGQSLEQDNQASSLVPISSGMAIIRPRLTLQSKSLAVVRPVASIQTAGLLPAPLTKIEPVTAAQEANLFVRLAQRITSTFSAFRASTQPTPIVNSPPPVQITEQSRSVPGFYGSSLDLPIVRVTMQPPAWSTSSVIKALASPAPVVVPLPAERAVKTRKRLAGRPTRPAKVQLETVAEVEEIPEGRMVVMNTGEQKVTASSDTRIEGRIGTAKRGALSGSGFFERGQSEVAVANPYIAPTSVVVVTLTGDPGPVVVQYVSLRPHEGFTIHLSSPAITSTPYNYVVLMGELF